MALDTRLPLPGARLALSLVVALLASVALVSLPAPRAEAACTPTIVVVTNPDGTTHEVMRCVENGSDPGGPGSPGSGGQPVPEFPKTFLTDGGCGFPFTGPAPYQPPGVTFDTTAYCPQPPCPNAQNRYARWLQPAAGAVAQFRGTYCADPGAGQAPVITSAMVVAAAEQVAPQPVAQVQPGTRSYVNIPNNYFTDSQPTTVPVTLLGQTFQVTFQPDGDTWDFGDGATASGSGLEDAAVGAAGAVEHAYAVQGTYSIHVSRSYTVTFALPGGAVTVPAAFTVAGADSVLPVGEIQTRVDLTR